MKNIWIFGDSYSDEFNERHDWAKKYIDYKGYKPKNFGDFINDKSEYKVFNRAKNGSSNYSILDEIRDNLKNFQISKNDVCQFFNNFSKKGSRGTIVDIDPFGSPAKYIDCGIRATIHKGLLSVSATDLQVLHGLFNDACKKKYHGLPIKTEYSNEISIRLILGLIITVAARLDVEATPLFVETNQHYYRTYLRILNKPDTRNKIGYIVHCKNCGSRYSVLEPIPICELCSHKMELAGPLWIGKLFDTEFVKKMSKEIPDHVDKKCQKIIQKAFLESDMPSCYFTLDEIAERLKIAPIPLEEIISRLQANGFFASPTSFNPTGFRTNCKVDKIKEIFNGKLKQLNKDQPSNQAEAVKPITETKSNEQQFIADEPVLPNKPLSEKQMGVIGIAKSMGNKYSPEIEKQYTDQKQPIKPEATVNGKPVEAEAVKPTVLGNIFEDRVHLDRYETFQKLYNKMHTEEEQCMSCDYRNYCYQCPAGNVSTGTPLFRPDDMCQKIVKLYLDLQDDIKKKQSERAYRKLSLGL